MKMETDEICDTETTMWERQYIEALEKQAQTHEE
jgi:hypothetical protein